jgi:hypothetical protein
MKILFVLRGILLIAKTSGDEQVSPNRGDCGEELSRDVQPQSICTAHRIGEVMNAVASNDQVSDTLSLTAEEANRLKKLERQIFRGSRLLIGIGKGLAEINRDKLYRGTHATFEEYVGEKFGFTRGHAYNLINAAEADVNIRSIGGTAPTNEFQLRPLIKLTPEQQRGLACR